MPKFFKFPFANSGDQSAIPDDAQTSGLLSYESGYGDQYSLDPRTDILARRVNRGRFNRLLNDITANLKFWQTEVYPEWVDPTFNDGNPIAYKLGAIVVYGGEYKVSLVANNTTEPNDPVNWDDAFPMPQALTHRPGDILIRAVDGVVPGFVELDGGAIDSVNWPILFAQYGTNLPDVRDRGIYGLRAGRTMGSYEEGQVKEHAHPVTESTVTLNDTFTTTSDGQHRHDWIDQSGVPRTGITWTQGGESASIGSNRFGGSFYGTQQYLIDLSGSHNHDVTVNFGGHDHGVVVENFGQTANTIDNVGFKVLIRVG